MIGFNIIIVLGTVVSDGKKVVYANGKKTYNFSIATKNVGVEYPQYINCRVREELMEQAMKYCKKGKLILVRGKMCVNWYRNKHGDNAYNPYVYVSHIECIPKSAIVLESQSIDKLGIYEEI